MRFEQRVRRLEAKTRDRLAAAAAAASFVDEVPPSLEEAREMDPQVLFQKFRESLNPRAVTETDEYRRLHAQYRRMPLRELLHLYVQLKRLQEEIRVQRKLDDERTDAEFMAFLRGEIEEFAPQSSHGSELDKARGGMDPGPDRTASLPAAAPEAWRPESGL